MTKIRYYDTHAHYGQRYRKTSFYEDRDKILRKAYEHGIVKIVNAAIGMTSNYSMLEDFKRYPFGGTEDCSEAGLPQVRIAIGEHPNWVGGEMASYFDEAKEKELSELCSHARVCAMKTGLDYSLGTDNQTRQKERFLVRIRMSKKAELPLVLHVRAAYEDALEILREEMEGDSYRGVIHCFTQGKEIAEEFIKMGFLLGIGGKVTYEKNRELREAVRDIPLEYLVLETDCPYVPLCKSKETNTSLDIPSIAQVVAEIKGISLEEVAEVTYQNAEKIFG